MTSRQNHKMTEHETGSGMDMSGTGTGTGNRIGLADILSLARSIDAENIIAGEI